MTTKKRKGSLRDGARAAEREGLINALKDVISAYERANVYRIDQETSTLPMPERATDDALVARARLMLPASCRTTAKDVVKRAKAVVAWLSDWRNRSKAGANVGPFPYIEGLDELEAALRELPR